MFLYVKPSSKLACKDISQTKFFIPIAIFNQLNKSNKYLLCKNYILLDLVRTFKLNICNRLTAINTYAVDYLNAVILLRCLFIAKKPSQSTPTQLHTLPHTHTHWHTLT